MSISCGCAKDAVRCGELIALERFCVYEFIVAPNGVRVRFTINIYSLDYFTVIQHANIAFLYWIAIISQTFAHLLDVIDNHRLEKFILRKSSFYDIHNRHPSFEFGVNVMTLCLHNATSMNRWLKAIHTELVFINILNPMPMGE